MYTGKNPNGEGSLRQRKDGRWEFRVKVEGRTTPSPFTPKIKMAAVPKRNTGTG